MTEDELLQRSPAPSGATADRYRRRFEASPDGVLLLDAKRACIEDANVRALEMLGVSRAELIGKRPWALSCLAGAHWPKTLEVLRAKDLVLRRKLELNTGAGPRLLIELIASAYDCDGGRTIELTLRDVTIAHEEAARRDRQTQCRTTLSRCNRAILHSASEAELFPKICEAAVLAGGMKMAWIGSARPGTSRIEPVASFGDDTGYLQGIEITVDGASPLGQGHTGTAIRENRAQWCQDFQGAAAQSPWHQRGASAGWASSACLPLRQGGAAAGALTLYSGQPGAFDETMRELLEEIADNVSFALDNFAREARRVRAESGLQRESRRNQVFLRNASDAVHILDREGRILEVSDSFCAMLGYRREEMIGMHVSEWDVQSAEALQQALARQFESDDRSAFETRHRRRDGTVVDVEITAQPLELDGRPALFNSARDISKRKQAEATLRLQGAALNAASNPIFITDRAGTIEWVNAAFSAVTGYSAAEAVGKNPRVLVKSGAHDRAFYEQMWTTLLAGKVWRGEVTNRRKDGTQYIEDVTITPVLDARGECTHFIAIKRDLTEEKRQQARFLQAQKMESIGRLAGGVAHDFNNLLTVILSWGEVALDDLKDGDPLRDCLTQICNAGHRAAALTSQLLMFSRQQVLAPKVVDLNGLIANMDKMLQRVLGEDIDLVSLRSPRLGLVKIDKSSFEQVIMNLAVNARDAMPAGGQLTIETSDVVLDESFSSAHAMKPGPHVMLAVTDTGQGMNRATQARIFEPFFTTKGIGKGTGLGLSTVFGIVQQSGGTVSVYSEPGHGTSFKVYLPRAGGDTTPEEAPLPPIAGRGSETILLVEDEDAVRGVARQILQRLGYRVLEARNGEEGLIFANAHPGKIDLLLTDVVMPVMSGPVLAKRLAEARPGLRVICMSGYTDDSIVRHGVLESKIAFLQKPLTPDTLKRKVREVLDARAPSSPLAAEPIR